MTPIYRSPDHDQTSAIRSLLQDHNIQSSIIETRKSNKPFGSSSVTWYELWLRHYADATRAKSIITQHEFSAFKNDMSSYRTTVVTQTSQAGIGQGLQQQQQLQHQKQQRVQPSSDELLLDEHAVGEQLLTNDPPSPPVQPVFTKKQPGNSEPKRREDLIPINNKRVFKRLGLLLGYSEEEIDKLDSNKLYRPWDANALMERVKNLKQKCS